MDSRSYEEELAQNGTIAFPVKGVSMRPLIKAGRDVVYVTAKQGRLSRYDVGLFKRGDSTYVLHRVMEVKDDGYEFCGDNQTFYEYVSEDNVLGSMEGLVRKGKTVNFGGLAYKSYVFMWCTFYRIRCLCLRVIHRLGFLNPN